MNSTLTHINAAVLLFFAACLFNDPAHPEGKTIDPDELIWALTEGLDLDARTFCAREKIITIKFFDLYDEGGSYREASKYAERASVGQVYPYGRDTDTATVYHRLVELVWASYDNEDLGINKGDHAAHVEIASGVELGCLKHFELTP